MSKLEEEYTQPLSPPQFIREREAWFKAGASAALAYILIATFAVGFVVAFTALFMGFGEHAFYAALTVVGGMCCCFVYVSMYIEVTARKVAYRGGVEIDRF